MASAVIVFYGSSNYGEASFLSSWVQQHIEEKALALEAPRQLSSAQMADINSIYAGVGGDGASGSPEPSTDAATVQDSAIVALTPPDSGYIERFSGKRAGVIEYTVQDGDLLSFIASDYGVTQASIIWANKLKDADSLTPGQTLRIPPITGVVHKAVSGDTATSLAKKYGGDAERIIAYNRLPKDGTLSVGEEVIIPDGKAPQVASAVGKSPLTKAGTTFSHLPDLGDYFMKPATGRITQYIHGRNGIDIANQYGTPIYAAASGVVAIADAVGYNGGYGQYIKIIHPNGTRQSCLSGSARPFQRVRKLR
jgi:LysM repeat protein